MSAVLAPLVREPVAPAAVAAPAGGAARSARRALRFALLPVRLTLAIAVGVGAVLATAVTLPNLFGARSLTVMSGSMEPTIHTGDVVVEDRIPAEEARIGDIVTFRDPSDPSLLITHRVRAMRIENGSVVFETKGDANNTVEHWAVPSGGSIGRVRLHVVGIGYVLVAARSSIGRLGLVAIPVLLLGIGELVRIWRPRREPAAGVASPPAAGTAEG